MYVFGVNIYINAANFHISYFPLQIYCAYLCTSIYVLYKYWLYCPILCNAVQSYIALSVLHCFHCPILYRVLYCIEKLLLTYVHGDWCFLQSWAHRSLKSLNRSSLLSEPAFWERWRSIRKRAKREEQTDKIKFWVVRSGAILGKKSVVKMVEKRFKRHNLYIF